MSSNLKDINPGLCRCCGELTKHKLLNEPYNCMGQVEIYQDMISYCFGIILSGMDEPGRHLQNCLICGVCTMKLRDAFTFKKQVEKTEMAFIQKRGIPQVPKQQVNSSRSLSRDLESIPETPEPAAQAPTCKNCEPKRCNDSKKIKTEGFDDELSGDQLAEYHNLGNVLYSADIDNRDISSSNSYASDSDSHTDTDIEMVTEEIYLPVNPVQTPKKLTKTTYITDKLAKTTNKANTHKEITDIADTRPKTTNKTNKKPSFIVIMPKPSVESPRLLPETNEESPRLLPKTNEESPRFLPKTSEESPKLLPTTSVMFATLQSKNTNAPVKLLPKILSRKRSMNKEEETPVEDSKPKVEEVSVIEVVNIKEETVDSYANTEIDIHYEHDDMKTEGNIENTNADRNSDDEDENTHSNNCQYIMMNSYAYPFQRTAVRVRCYYCGKYCPEYDQLRKHALTHSPQEFQHNGDKLIKLDITRIDCRLCKENINSLEELSNHLKKSHRKRYFSMCKSGIIPYKLTQNRLTCVVCYVRFTSFLDLDDHMEEHYSRYVCGTRNDVFLDEESLKAHLSTYENARHSCALCHRTFDTATALKIHATTCHNDDPEESDWSADNVPKEDDNYLVASDQEKSTTKTGKRKRRKTKKANANEHYFEVTENRDDELRQNDHIHFKIEDNTPEPRKKRGRYKKSSPKTAANKCATDVPKRRGRPRKICT